MTQRGMQLLVIALLALANTASGAEAPSPQGGPQANPAPRRQGPPVGRGPGRGRGPDERFVEDHNVFFFLLDHRDVIRRTVTELPTGIETVTESDNAEVAAKIQEHVAAMYDRVENVNPIHLRDPLFREIFANAKKIAMEMTETDKGLRVKETSEDPYVARLLQAHARVVSLFIKNGRPELHRNHAVPQRDQRPEPTLDEAASCTACQLNSFAQFDRAYIPALALTKQEQAAAAGKAVDRLQQQWLQLRPILTECRNDWAADLDKVTTAIERAEQRVATNELLGAHEELEVIRDTFMALRKQSGIRYELDALNEFHAIMEEIVKPATTMEPTDLNEAARARFADLSHQAGDAWQQVTATDFDAQRFQLNDARQAKLQALIAAQTERVAAFQMALQGDEPQRILVTARALKPGFAAVYMFFGQQSTGQQSTGQQDASGG